MASNSLTFTRKSPLLLPFTDCSRIPTSHFASQTRFPAKPVQISGLRSCSSCNHGSSVLNFSHGKAKSNDLGSLEIGNRQSGPDNFRVFAVSESSAGGHGGSGNGNSSSNGGGGGGGDSGSGGGSNWSLLSWYLSLLAKYPVWTKAVTSALLNFIGDLTCQLLIDQVPSLDIKRIFLFTFLGLVLVGPTLHFWYLYLSKLVTVPGASGAFLRLLLDQFVFSPMFIGVFLSTLVTLEGRPSQVLPKLQQEWFSAVLANWQLWIPFQFLNFRFVPQQFQVLAANFIALIWNIILSYKAHREVLTK